MDKDKAVAVLKVTLKNFIYLCDVLVKCGVITKDDRQHIVNNAIDDIKKTFQGE